MSDADSLEAERAERWWHTRRRIGSIERAAAFLDDVGFALLFPKTGLAVPSLWEAVSDRTAESLPREWGPDIDRVWGWKDELPDRRLAWYGHKLFGRPSFLSKEMLRLLYPRPGKPGDFRDADLSPDAGRIAEVLLSSGPTASATLRLAVGLDGKAGGNRFSKAIVELGRRLVVTHAGTEEMDAGWPSAVFDLTARAFRIGRRPADAFTRAAERYLRTVVQAKPRELARAFGWTAATAQTELDSLVQRGRAVRSDSSYLHADARGLY